MPSEPVAVSQPQVAARRCFPAGNGVAQPPVRVDAHRHRGEQPSLRRASATVAVAPRRFGGVICTHLCVSAMVGPFFPIRRAVAGGHLHARAAQRVDVANPRRRHKAGTRGSAGASCPGLPVPHPPARTTGAAGCGVHQTPESGVCSRLLLASPWLCEEFRPQVPRGVLADQVRVQRRAGPQEPGSTDPRRLAGLRCLGVRSREGRHALRPACGFPRTAAAGGTRLRCGLSMHPVRRGPDAPRFPKRPGSAWRPFHAVASRWRLVPLRFRRCGLTRKEFTVASETGWAP